MILIVSYDLQPGSDSRTPFYEALKLQGTWWHYLTSTWLISTTKTPEEVYRAIVSTMVQADRVLIFELGKSYNGWLAKEAWDWIQQQQAVEAVRTMRITSPPIPPPSIPGLAEFLKMQEETKTSSIADLMKGLKKE